MSDVQERYDVFLVFTETDKQIASEIKACLERRKFSVISQLDGRAFKAGEPIFDNVVKHVENSDKTLIVLTLDSYKNKWILLEAILSAEKSNRDGRMGLRVVLKDLEEHQIPQLKKGLLEKVPHLKIEIDSTWEERLANFISKEITVGDLLPVGCLAHGQIFSHFTGFLRHVLPGYKGWIKKIAQENDLPLGEVCTKYFILLPGSCKIQDSLETVGGSEITIRHVNSLIMTKMHVGKPREYKLSLYSISNGPETYYFVADYPNVLSAIYKLQADNLADVDLKYQIARFYFTLNELMNHQQNKAFNDTVEIVIYDDNIEILADVLFPEVKRSLQLPVSREEENIEEIVTDLQKAIQLSTLRLISTKEKRECDAYISCADDTESLKIADKIEQFLKANRKTVAREAPNIPLLKQLERGAWIIIIISKAFLEEKNKTFECKSVLAACINENALRILPVVCDDVAVTMLPKYMKFITHVSISEPNYLQNIFQKMNGEPIRMCEKIPCGDVATGLAWAYVINYLVITLLFKDFKRRIKDFLPKEAISSEHIEKLFILVPESCLVPDDLTHEANRCEPNRKVDYLGDLEPVVTDSGGQHQRTYYLHVYKYTNTDTGRQMCFVSEYATPIKCLYDMAHDYPFAGLEKEDMYRQAADFATLTKDIVNRAAVKEKKGDISALVDFVHFDDRPGSLMDALEQKFDQEQDQIVYKRDMSK